MIFYPSKNNNALNGQEFAPERVNGRAMVNPLYPVRLARGTEAIMDSGAFQECAPWLRRLPWSALSRQLDYAARLMRAGTLAPVLMTYDQVCGVDEFIDEHGKKQKRRGTIETGAAAVAETIYSARYYHSQAHRIPGPIGYACQGIDPEQYADCASALIPLIRPGVDWFAFGGFCIIGQKPALKPVFYATLRTVLPLLHRAGVHRAHILGVTVADAILEASLIAAPFGITLSTDSSGPERNAAVYGREFVTSPPGPRFTAKWGKADKGIKYQPAEWAMEQIARYDGWCKSLQAHQYAQAAD